jgi:hypothetical protein
MARSFFALLLVVSLLFSLSLPLRAQGPPPPGSPAAPKVQVLVCATPYNGTVKIYKYEPLQGRRGRDPLLTGNTGEPCFLEPGDYTIEVTARQSFFSFYRSEIPNVRITTLTMSQQVQTPAEMKVTRWGSVIFVLVLLALALGGAVAFIVQGRHKSQMKMVIERAAQETARITVFKNGVPEKIGDYTVLGKLGQGGMATVYRVQSGAGDIFALKVPHAHVFEIPEFKNRFLREADIIKSLHHPHIVRMFDYGVGENYSVPYICMEFVEGMSLKSFMDKNPSLPIKKAAGIITDVASALGYAHERGIVHRDIKPENVMITKKNEIKLMDLGIARTKGSKTLTATGMTLGTPYYMAPEQVESKSVDKRADLYSLGVVLYELLTGKLPFDAEEPINVIIMHLNDTPPPPRKHNSHIPPELELIVLRLLEKDPAHRFQSADELVSALQKYL